ncbi:MAG: dicarboxylate/amino acid:cation symporter [Verrucomicrobia bacterium]|nr:dicarboxylate/amino acid:cation symporter [Verrucomicrobiota bacterium]
MAKKKKQAPIVILIAIFLAFILGNITGTESSIFGVTYYSIFDLFGKLFIHSLTLIVVPLVSSSIILGVARIGKDQSFGRLSLKIFSFYVATTLSAILIGLLLVNVLAPGVDDSLRDLVKQGSLAMVQKPVGSEEAVGLSKLLLSIIPSNVFEAFAKGEMLAVIFFSLFFGFSLSKIKGAGAETLQNFFQGLFDSMITMTQLIMRCLPFGVFCLVAKVAATTGFKSLASLAWFFFTVLGSLIIFSLVVLPLFLRFIGKVSPKNHFKSMMPALITAFSTSSSSASLPITMDCLEKRAGISNRICSLVVPLGTSLNMSGSALYECIAALFVAQVYGVDMALSAQVIVVILSLLTSMGVAGIPAASLVALIIILEAFGLPIEGIGLFLAVDRILDMCRTTVNVLSDSCCAVLVAKSEGEKGILTRTVFTE